MKDRHTSCEIGHEYLLPVDTSKSQKALKPELYFAQVDRATAEFSISEKCPSAMTGCVNPIALLGSGIVCSRNLLAPAYLFKPASKIRPYRICKNGTMSSY